MEKSISHWGLHNIPEVDDRIAKAAHDAFWNLCDSPPRPYEQASQTIKDMWKAVAQAVIHSQNNNS